MGIDRLPTQINMSYQDIQALQAKAKATKVDAADPKLGDDFKVAVKSNDGQILILDKTDIENLKIEIKDLDENGTVDFDDIKAQIESKLAEATPEDDSFTVAEFADVTEDVTVENDKCKDGLGNVFNTAKSGQGWKLEGAGKFPNYENLLYVIPESTLSQTQKDLVKDLPKDKNGNVLISQDQLNNIAKVAKSVTSANDIAIKGSVIAVPGEGNLVERYNKARYEETVEQKINNPESVTVQDIDVQVAAVVEEEAAVVEEEATVVEEEATVVEEEPVLAEKQQKAVDGIITRLTDAVRYDETVNAKYKGKEEEITNDEMRLVKGHITDLDQSGIEALAKKSTPGQRTELYNKFGKDFTQKLVSLALASEPKDLEAIKKMVTKDNSKAIFESIPKEVFNKLPLDVKQDFIKKFNENGDKASIAKLVTQNIQALQPDAPKFAELSAKKAELEKRVKVKEELTLALDVDALRKFNEANGDINAKLDEVNGQIAQLNEKYAPGNLDQQIAESKTLLMTAYKSSDDTKYRAGLLKEVIQTPGFEDTAKKMLDPATAGKNGFAWFNNTSDDLARAIVDSGVDISTLSPENKSTLITALKPPSVGLEDAGQGKDNKNAIGKIVSSAKNAEELNSLLNAAGPDAIKGMTPTTKQLIIEKASSFTKEVEVDGEQTQKIAPDFASISRLLNGIENKDEFKKLTAPINVDLLKEMNSQDRMDLLDVAMKNNDKKFIELICNSGKDDKENLALLTHYNIYNNK